MIDWFKTLFRLVRAYRKSIDDGLDCATRAVFLFADGRTQMMTLPHPLGIVRLPRYQARWWKDGEPPEAPRLHVFRMKGIESGLAFYLEDGAVVSSNK